MNNTNNAKYNGANANNNDAKCAPLEQCWVHELKMVNPSRCPEDHPGCFEIEERAPGQEGQYQKVKAELESLEAQADEERKRVSLLRASFILTASSLYYVGWRPAVGGGNHFRAPLSAFNANASGPEKKKKRGAEVQV